MVVDLVNVFLHLRGERRSDFAVAGFASQVCCVSIELCFQIDQNRTARCEFLIGDRLLKFRVAFVHLRVKRGGIKSLFGHGEFVNESEMKAAQAFNLRVAAGFGESRSATARDG
jgi:hypothetical protein